MNTKMVFGVENFTERLTGSRFLMHRDEKFSVDCAQLNARYKMWEGSSFSTLNELLIYCAQLL